VTASEWRRRVFKPAVWLACLAPLAYLVYSLYLDPGANPIETVTNFTGIWTLRLIVATLAISPLRWLTGFNPLINYRRLVGLFAFFYASMHFTIYVVTTFFIGGFSNFDASGLWDDLVKRPYITAGFTAFVLMIPLAVTSTAGWIRRLGGKRWNALHRLIYITALAAVLHYFWKVKLDATFPVYYGIGVAILLGFRVWRHFAKRRASEV
jgi:methionine sulfoxide reductase heme-binding subunit